MADDLDPTATLPTPGEVEEMRERHRHMERTEHGLWCPQCLMPWPCDAARLLALVGSLRHLADVLKAGAAADQAALIETSARLAAVLAECDAADKPGMFRRGGVSTDHIRRAATGGTP